MPEILTRPNLPANNRLTFDPWPLYLVGIEAELKTAPYEKLQAIASLGVERGYFIVKFRRTG